ncbi:MAG: Hdr-like menaquinol oxidoreductase cytochrome c subunit [Alphaproteobacteria bacterium]
MPARLSHILALTVLLASVLVSVSLGAGPAAAAEAGQASRVFIPAPPKGKGDKCVADTAFMRRYHMTMLDHQRDDTVHEGIRTKQFSLKECIACHAVNGPDARPVTIKSPKHFCRSCHDYAAVKVDCFECHASRPEPGKAAMLPVDHGDNAFRALAGYLEGKGQ